VVIASAIGTRWILAVSTMATGCNAILDNGDLRYVADAGASNSSDGGKQGSNMSDGATSDTSSNQVLSDARPADAVAPVSDAQCGDPIACKLPAGAKIGVIRAEGQACPADYGQALTLHSGAKDTGCSNCANCVVSSQCVIPVSVYSIVGNCSSNNKSALSSGILGDKNLTCIAGWGGPSVGYVLDAPQVVETRSGTNTNELAPPTWQKTVQFCSRSIGAAATLPTECILYDSSVSCPLEFPVRDDAYYESLVDERACTCQLEQVTMGTCSSPSVAIWTDESCSVAQKIVTPPYSDCASNNAHLSMKYVGQAVSAGTCRARGQIDGSIRPTNQHTLCCR
jgi:hypothetical protein